MSKQFWIALIAIVAIFVGVVTFNNHAKHNTVSSYGQPTNHIEGQDSKGVTLVEYGDYECPVCGAFYPTVKQVVSNFSTQIRFQFRNLPLTSIHPNAFAGARAAEAAGLQDHYWQMHDQLYENQSSWANSQNPLSYFNSYATQIGLNVQQFDNDYGSTKVSNAINADLAAFNQTGDEMETPTFYLDGTKLNNANLLSNGQVPSVDAFSKFINDEIAKKSH